MVADSKALTELFGAIWKREMPRITNRCSSHSKNWEFRPSYSSLELFSCPKLDILAQHSPTKGGSCTVIPCRFNALDCFTSMVGTRRSVILFRLFRLAGVGGCNALRTQVLSNHLSFRSPPPLPAIFVMGWDLTKIHGAKSLPWVDCLQLRCPTEHEWMYNADRRNLCSPPPPT